MLFYLKGITKMGDNSDKTKKYGSLFFFFFFFFFFFHETAIYEISKH